MTSENQDGTGDFFDDLDNEYRDSADEYLEKIRREAYRYHEIATITEVNGTCPYGHKQGDVHKLTNMNSDNMCGSLYNVIHPSLTTLHYGGTLPWKGDPTVFNGTCEEGIVKTEIKRVQLEKPIVFRTPNTVVDMTGKGFEGIDKYRIYLEVLGVANHCTWGHKEDHKIELDLFNIGKVCGFLYWEIYQYVNLLLSGGSAPWEPDPNIMHGCCPDPYNQVTYRLIREER